MTGLWPNGSIFFSKIKTQTQSRESGSVTYEFELVVMLLRSSAQDRREHEAISKLLRMINIQTHAVNRFPYLMAVKQEQGLIVMASI